MITQQDLIDRFGADELAELTDPEDHKVINEATVGLAIADAVGVAGGYLNAVGLVRRDSTGNFVYIDSVLPADLILNVCNIARYNLHKDGATETVEKRYDDAKAWLKDVKKDPTMLTGEKPVTGNANSSIAVMPNPVPSIYGD
ncbi:MAG: DUF1320 domain-containing protein [Psychrobacter sp.]|nr:DUF1320 domain-containing protein [Psychrobacter sp.]